MQMTTPGVVIADAGQAFETLPQSSIYAFLEKLSEGPKRESRVQAVFVMHGPRAVCGFGGSVKRKYSDRTILLSRSVIRCFHGFMGMRYFRLGNVWLFQRKGVPIGGPLSGHILDSILGDIEFEYDKAKKGRQSLFMAGRFADDVLLVSFVICTCCLERQLHELFKEIVSFDVDSTIQRNEETGPVIANYLNGTLHINFGSFKAVPRHKNESYAFTGL